MGKKSLYVTLYDLYFFFLWVWVEGFTVYQKLFNLLTAV